MKNTAFVYILLNMNIIPVIAMAQDSSLVKNEGLFFQTIRANHDESYMTFSQGIGNMEDLVFEGLVAPYFLLRTSENAKWGATLSPMILIRMFAEPSFPVRTPSYMPQVTFYHQISYKETQNIKYVFVTIAHHSNGQEEPFYLEDGSINTFSGDFSTNYVQIGAFFNRRLLSMNNTGEYFQTSIEIHPNIDRSVELNGRYSFLKWHTSFRVFRFPSDWKLSKLNQNPKVQTTLKTTWLFGEMDNAKNFDAKERLNISATINYRPEVLKDVSLFANFYSGKDYYNMQFDRRIQVFRIGLQAYAFK